MKIYFYALFLMLSLLTGCESKQKPTEVATNFWQAIQENNLGVAKGLSVNMTDNLQAELQKFPKDVTIEFGELTMSDDKAQLQTFFTRASKEASNGNETLTERLQIQTELVYTEGQWKVDAERTLQAYRDTQISQSMDELSHQLEQTFKEGADLFKELMGEGAKEFGKTLSDSMQELNQQLRELIEELKREHQTDQAI